MRDSVTIIPLKNLTLLFRLAIYIFYDFKHLFIKILFFYDFLTEQAGNRFIPK